MTDIGASLWLGARSLDSMEDAGILPEFAGMVVTDRYQNYFNPRWKREWDECYAPAAMMGWQVQGLP